MLDRVIEGHDLTLIHTLLTLVGFFLALYVMQLTSHAHEDQDDPWLLRWINRVTFAGLALALLWSLSYSITKSWQPWPPDVALDLAVIVLLAGRAWAILSHIKRDDVLATRGRQQPSPRVRVEAGS
jgi:hypothetical protein